MDSYPFAIPIILFTTTCFGFGYLAEFVARRRRLPVWFTATLIFGAALIWPILLVAYVIYDSQRYLALHPHDDAPGMVLVSVVTVAAPFLFFLSFLPILIGVIVAKVISRIPRRTPGC